MRQITRQSHPNYIANHSPITRRLKLLLHKRSKVRGEAEVSVCVWKRLRGRGLAQYQNIRISVR